MSDKIRKGGIQNPFNTYDQFDKSVMDKPFETFSAYATTGTLEQETKKRISGFLPYPVSLPKHLFMPEDSQSADFRASVVVAAGAIQEIFAFRAPASSTTIFINYALASNAPIGSNIAFIPTVNDIRVLPYHGNPSNNFTIQAFTGSDISLSTPIQCLLQLQPSDVFKWVFVNNTLNPVEASARMQGYIDTSTTRKIGRFGG